MMPSPIAVTAADSMATVDGSSSDANGTRAARRPMAMSSPNVHLAARATGAPMASGMPASTSQPTGTAIAPTIIAGNTSPAAARFAAGATSERRPKATRTMGVVAA